MTLAFIRRFVWAAIMIAPSAPLNPRDSLILAARAARRSTRRRYQVRRDISSLSQGFLASIVLARSSIRGRPVFGAQNNDFHLKYSAIFLSSHTRSRPAEYSLTFALITMLYCCAKSGPSVLSQP
jgi:hypothetical protein